MINSNGPIGRGETTNLKRGNAILTTINLNGNEIKNYLWIDSFNSDLNMEVSMSQLKRGLTYRPVRLQERVLTFNTIWNVADRPKYLQLIDNIRTHWSANLNESIPTPNKLTYFGANKTWYGFVLNGDQAYAITDVVLRYAFNMKVITTQNTNDYATPKGIAPFMPTAGDVSDFGEQWYGASQIVSSQTDDTAFDQEVEKIAPAAQVNPRQFL